MNLLRSLFKSRPQISIDEIIREAGLENTELLATCELNLVGQRTGPREISCIIALKDKDLVIVPLDHSLPAFNMNAPDISVVRPRSDELRFKTKTSTVVAAEYFKIDRPSFVPENPALIRWSKELALKFFDELLEHGATEINQQQLSGR